MAGQGELQFTLSKIDDLTAYELVGSIREHFEIAEQITVKIAHGIRIEAQNYGIENILPSEYKIQEFHLSGVSQKSGHHVGFVFARYEIGKPDSQLNLRYDYASLTLGGDVNYWREKPSLAIEASALLARLTIPAPSKPETDETEMFRQLIIGQDASHRRMLAELNTQLKELAARRTELEQEAAATEQARKAAHDEAQARLEQQKAELDRQSHMAERRKIGKGMRCP